MSQASKCSSVGSSSEGETVILRPSFKNKSSQCSEIIMDLSYRNVAFSDYAQSTDFQELPENTNLHTLPEDFSARRTSNCHPFYKRRHNNHVRHNNLVNPSDSISNISSIGPVSEYFTCIGSNHLNTVVEGNEDNRIDAELLKKVERLQQQLNSTQALLEYNQSIIMQNQWLTYYQNQFIGNQNNLYLNHPGIANHNPNLQEVTSTSLESTGLYASYQSFDVQENTQWNNNPEL